MPIQGDLEKQRVGWRQDWMTTVADREAIVALLNEVAAEDIVEIGVHEGWTARCILDNVPTVKRYRGIDVLPNSRLACHSSSVSCQPALVVTHGPIRVSN